MPLSPRFISSAPLKLLHACSLINSAGPLVWASGRAGWARPSPFWAELGPAQKIYAKPGRAQPSQKNNKNKK